MIRRDVGRRAPVPAWATLAGLLAFAPAAAAQAGAAAGPDPVRDWVAAAGTLHATGERADSDSAWRADTTAA
jgi:hypothetical protein